tara:strand:+ start:185 stop:442 length:258 start_codon:yes stop_codon:yes gene_type:complete
MSFIAEELTELIEYTIKDENVFPEVSDYEYFSEKNMTEDEIRVFQCGYIEGLKVAILKLQDHYPSDLSESITEFWDDEEMYGAED